MAVADAVSFGDFRRLARARLPRILFDYIDGGSYGEITIGRNAADLDRVELPQRVMRDMSKVSLQTEVLGQTLDMPVVLGPVGFAGMYARRGEVQAARAARQAGIAFTLSTVGICSAEEVKAGSGTAPWFQLYMVRDRGLMADLLNRTAELGSPVLVLTVDLPTPGTRYRDLRSGMGRPLGLLGHISQALDGARHPAWLYDVYLRGRPHRFGNLAGALSAGASFADAWAWIKANFDPSVTWAEIDFVRRHWKGPIVVKGVLHPDDARAAREAGADALVVSNHGGRQLDGVCSTAIALPRIAEALAGTLPLFADGGVRSGLDVLKLRTLGADVVMLGKAWAFALAAGGETGVERMLTLMRQELTTAMVLSGTSDMSSGSL
jgi:L-lactate dehydrogenase (cytochrome)